MDKQSSRFRLFLERTLRIRGAQRVEQGSKRDSLHITLNSLSNTSLAQALPTEIMLIIFAYLVPPAFDNDAFAFHYSNPAHLDYEINGLSSVRNVQGDIATLVRVCRVWRAIFIELLYPRVFLTSYQRIRSFARTVRQTSFLAGLVKEVIVLNEERAVEEKAPSIASYLYRFNDQSESKMARADLALALRYCKSARMLCIKNLAATEATSFIVDNDFVKQSLGTMEKVDRLIIWGALTKDRGKTPTIMTPDAVLPGLRILSLREVDFSSTFTFPTLPLVQTLQISRSFEWRHSLESGSFLVITSGCFPNLRTLELYQNNFEIRVEPKCFRGLQRLHLFGRCESMIMPTMGQSTASQHSSPIDNLRQLAFDSFAAPLEDRQEQLAAGFRRLLSPSTIESLSVRLRPSGYPIHSPDNPAPVLATMDVIIVNAILDHLHAGQTDDSTGISQTPSNLKRLTLIKPRNLGLETKSVGLMLEVESRLQLNAHQNRLDVLINRLREVCAEKGISVRVLENEDFGPWVTERLMLVNEGLDL